MTAIVEGDKRIIREKMGYNYNIKRYNTTLLAVRGKHGNLFIYIVMVSNENEV